MYCETCKHWKLTYAPFLKCKPPMMPYVFTCEYKDNGKLEFKGKCDYWEKKDE